MWAALAFEAEHRPSSIMLTVLAAQGYVTLDVEGFSGDDEYLRAVVNAALSRLRRNPAVANPVDTTENLNRLSKERSDAFVAGLDGLLSTADRALAAPTKSQAADIWAEAFHHFFPVPQKKRCSRKWPGR